MKNKFLHRFFAYSLLIIAAMITQGISAQISAAFSYLGLEASPRDISMAGSATSYPKGVAGFLTNPTALSEPTSKNYETPVSIYLSSYPMLFDYRNNAVYSRFPVGQFSVGAFLQTVTSENIEIYSDKGELTRSIGESFYSFGGGISHIFKLNREKILTGVNVKGFYSRLGDFSSVSAALDLGASYFFRLPRPKWLPYYSNLPNTTVSLVFKNIGIPGSFESASVLPPYSYEISGRSGVYSRRAHELDFYTSFEHTFTLGNISYSAGLEYSLYKILYIRTGFNISTYGDFTFSGGMGVENDVQQKYKYSLDYSIQNGVFGDVNHVFGVGFSYQLNQRTFKNDPKLDFEIAAEVQRFLDKTYERAGVLPETLEDVYIEMIRQGYPEPKFTAGRLLYVPQLKKAIYIRIINKKKQNNVVQLVDGTMVIGIIDRATDDGLTLDGEFGDLLVPYEKIKKVENLEMNNHDKTIRQRIQFLVNDFKKNKNYFPADMRELAKYCKKTLQVLPRTVQREIKYNPSTGKVLLF